MKLLLVKLLRHKKSVARFIIISVSVPVLVFGDLWLQRAIDVIPPYQPDSPLENVCNLVLELLALPLIVPALIAARLGFFDSNFADPDVRFLWLTPGLCWGFTVELFLLAKKRYGSHKPAGTLISN
jgi:hypothetical protein